MALLESSESYSPTSQHREIDASYSDPLGPLAERPRTSVGRKPQIHIEDEFGDEELGEDLLPV
ncbi:Intraflagellar transport protein 88 [Blattella germanica]|nr:Intraflagellar transport protein 88 [Blattella germanica]